MITSIILILISSIILFYLLPSPPPSLTTGKTRTRGNPLLSPGPIVSFSSSNLSLNGLTVIPIVHLPTIRVNFSFLFNYSLFVSFHTTSSELVFRTLEIDSISSQSKDVSQSPLDTVIKGVKTDFSGSFAIASHISLRRVIDEVGTNEKVWKWRAITTGRIDGDVKGLGLDVSTRLVQDSSNNVVLELLSTSIDVGEIQSMKLDGFGSLGGELATYFIPWFKNTWIVSLPTKRLVSFFIRELVEGKEVDQVLKELIGIASGHIDLSSFGGIVDDEREEQLRKKEVVNPLPTSSDSTSSSRTSTPIPPSQIIPILTNPPPASLFRLQAHLIGPTRLTSFYLPDLSPNLFPAGGNRAKLQSLNLLTDEFKLLLSENQLSQISFDRAEVAFDPNISLGNSAGGGELVITVSNFTVTLLSHFKIHANTSQIFSWTTGIKKIGEKGTSRTVVSSRSLQLRFRLNSKFRLDSSTISPFTTITASFTLSTPALALGTELLNLITSSLNELIAKGASLIVSMFMKDSVRKYLQGLLEGAEEGLRERGVELPSSLRGKE